MSDDKKTAREIILSSVDKCKHDNLEGLSPLACCDCIEEQIAQSLSAARAEAVCGVKEQCAKAARETTLDDACASQEAVKWANQTALQIAEDIEALPTLDCGHKQKAGELQTVLSAWQSVFGTSQLTHAQARLEAAESNAKRFKEFFQTTSRFIGNYRTFNYDPDKEELAAGRDWGAASKEILKLMEETIALRSQLAQAQGEMEVLRAENRQLSKEGLADALAEECESNAALRSRCAALEKVVEELREAAELVHRTNGSQGMSALCAALAAIKETGDG